MDRRPKRRKDKHNPYILEMINGKFYVSFNDSNKTKQKVEVSKEVYDCFDEYELIDISAMNEYDRHTEHSELSDSAKEKRSVKKAESFDARIDRLLYSELLHEAIKTLPEIQRRRLKKYYFEFKTFKEIGEEEGCEYQCVQRSVYRAREKLKRKLTK